MAGVIARNEFETVKQLRGAVPTETWPGIDALAGNERVSIDAMICGKRKAMRQVDVLLCEILQLWISALSGKVKRFSVC